MHEVSQPPVAGRFQVEREVGRGGVGIVYRAFDVVTEREVALKIIGESGVDVAEQQRLTREGQVLSELDHPGIVRVVAFGNLEDPVENLFGRRFERGTPYVAMEWLDGEDLQVRQRRAPLTLRQALDATRQVAAALSAAHDAGVIHRDIKPSNIFIKDRETPPGAEGEAGRLTQVVTKLVDFGVAAADDVRLTKTGAVVGTPAYMAPEQARGDSGADVRSDIYSLGATLFELIAGRPPHVGPTSIATLARLVTTPAPRLRDLLEVPDSLDELVYSMLLSERNKRPGSARDVAAQLDAILRDPELPEAARALTHDTHGSNVGTRFVTTLVGIHVASGEQRTSELARLRDEGAEALPLGADSIVVHLGARRAYGDEAVRALRLGQKLCERGARAGVATGRTRVDLTRSTGEVVDRAAALARDAEPGTLVADSTTSELARGVFEMERMASGAVVVGAPIHGRRDGGTMAPFLGREAELVAMLSAFERCTEDHTPLVVSVSGPPGIGKSRLGREFIARISKRDEPFQLIHIRCEAYGRAQALGVATDALRGLVGLPKGASFEQVEETVRALHLLHDDGGLLSRLLANQPFPSGIEPRGARDSLYLSMTELVLTAASKSPCAFVFEDVQWSDPESVAWVDHLLGRATGRSLFTLLMMRPQFWRDQAQRFSGRDHVRVELRPIARRATREIARAVIGASATDAMLDQVAQQAAGSPLFAEELARLIASGKDAARAPTIEAAIQVSLDALDDVAREAVVRMSVFGLSLWDGGLEAVGIRSPNGLLRKLVTSELLVENGTSRFATQREYLFKHALVRDVAYATAGEDLRRELHSAAATWLHSMGEDAATVAQHFDLGGKHEEAAVHWEAAARRALATNSLIDAVTMADRALVFASDRPTGFARAMLLDEAYSRLDARSSERESAIRAMAENVFDEPSDLRTMGARARYDDARASGMDIEDRLIEVRDRAAKLDLVEEEARCSATLAHRYAFAGQLPMAEREAAHLLDLSERRQIVSAAVDAWQSLAVVHQTRGELAAALEARRAAARAAHAAGLQEREAMLTVNVGFALTTIGADEEALQELQAGIAKAHAIGSAGTVRHGRMNLLGWSATFGADKRLDQALAEPRANADEAASGTWMIRDRVTLGVLFYRGCELLRGEPTNLPRARTLLKTAVEAYRSTDNRDVVPVALGFWAEAERRFGNAELALEIAREAATLLENGAPSLLNEAPVYLVLHDACVDIGDLKGARDATERGVAPLLRRMKGLEGTSYARTFLLGLAHNSGLLVAAEAYGCIPPEIEEILEQR